MTALFFGGGRKFPSSQKVKGIREAIALALADEMHCHCVEVGDDKGLIARYERRFFKNKYIFVKTG